MKTYLFDFDGTLVNSMPTFVSVMLRILKENNIKYEKDIVKTITPLGYGGTAKYFIDLGLNMSFDSLIKMMNDYAKVEYDTVVKAKESVKETLTILKEKGYSLNVLTASPHNILDDCLKRLELYDLFTNVWSCDDFNTTKADPNIYLMAAEKLGVGISEVLFFDDNIGALSTAKKSGMKTCGVYDDTSKDYIEDIKSITDKYIYTFNELL